MTCVNSSGVVDMKKLCPGWKYDNDVAYVLNMLRSEMNKSENKRLRQPPEGATYV